jgi:hypothetical protein
MKPKKKQPYIKKLDRLLSLYIRKRDGCCVICGSTQYLNCGHYFSRVFYNVRWDFKNCNTQCASCNKKHEYNPEPYRRWMVMAYGEETIMELEQKAHSGHKLSWDELHAIEAEIKRRSDLL